jgi:hypothetical protein
MTEHWHAGFRKGVLPFRIEAGEKRMDRTGRRRRPAQRMQ